MSQAATSLVFPIWRSLWTNLEGVPARLVKVDTLLERRASGNHQLPRWDPSSHGEQLTRVIRLLQTWSNKKPQNNPAIRRKDAEILYATVYPFLQAVVWPRWLLLERAFLDASNTGDLLFAALTLRTMCEELQRLHALDLDANQIANFAMSDKSADQKRLNLFVSISRVSLATLPEATILYGKGWPGLDIIRKSMPKLDSARQALNSYVHPNYGSHIAAIFPERTAAAKLLLEAVETVYEAFFKLSWSEQPVTREWAPLGVAPLETWERTRARFLSDVLPSLRQSTNHPAVSKIIKAPSIKEWLAKGQTDIEEKLDEELLRPLIESLPKKNLIDNNKINSENIHIWDGASPLDIINFSIIRRIDSDLVGEFPDEAPEMSDQSRWLHFHARSLELVMMLDTVKIAALKTQLFRQITQGNPLGIILCLRSLIEHRASTIWLSKNVCEALEDLARQVGSNKNLPKIGIKIEKSISKLLAAHGNKSKEDQHSWIKSETGDTRPGQLILNQIIDTAFLEKDRLRKIYKIASASMHGRVMRGGELIEYNSSNKMSYPQIGIIVLERFCDRNEEMDLISVLIRPFFLMKHAANLGGALGVENDRMAQQMFGHIEKNLTLGIDFNGKGTKNEPFEFNSHLPFYPASYALLEQRGINFEKCTRILDHDTSGNLCDRWKTPKRDYWFKLDPTAIFGLDFFGKR